MAVFGFEGLEDRSVYNGTRVVMVCGSHQVFNNTLIDRVRNIARGKIKLDSAGNTVENEEQEADELTQEMERIAKKNAETASEFGLSDDDEDNQTTSGAIDIDTFLEVCRQPSLLGKWYCCVALDSLSKKQKDKVEKYLKNTSEYAVLVLICTDFREKNKYKKMQLFKISMNMHIVDLSYPRRNMLNKLVSDGFRKHNVKVADAGLDAFVLRMGNAYDQYEEAIEEIVMAYGEDGVLTLDDINNGLKGKDVVSIDSFVASLTNQMGSRKVVRNRGVYKELASLMRSFTCREILTKVRYRIRDMLEYRVLINTGKIPVTCRYSAQGIKDSLPDEHKLKKKPDPAFKRDAFLASKTSLRDWFFMKMIVDSIKPSATEQEMFRVLIALVNRATLSNDRLMNVIKVKDTLEEGLVDLNALFYSDWWQSLPRTEDGEVILPEITVEDIDELKSSMEEATVTPDFNTELAKHMEMQGEQELYTSDMDENEEETEEQEDDSAEDEDCEIEDSDDVEEEDCANEIDGMDWLKRAFS